MLFNRILIYIILFSLLAFQPNLAFAKKENQKKQETWASWLIDSVLRIGLIYGVHVSINALIRSMPQSILVSRVDDNPEPKTYRIKMEGQCVLEGTRTFRTQSAAPLREQNLHVSLLSETVENRYPQLTRFFIEREQNGGFPRLDGGTPVLALVGGGLRSRGGGTYTSPQAFEIATFMEPGRLFADYRLHIIDMSSEILRCVREGSYDLQNALSTLEYDSNFGEEGALYRAQLGQFFKQVPHTLEGTNIQTHAADLGRMRFLPSSVDVMIMTYVFSHIAQSLAPDDVAENRLFIDFLMSLKPGGSMFIDSFSAALETAQLVRSNSNVQLFLGTVGTLIDGISSFTLSIDNVVFKFVLLKSTITDYRVDPLITALSQRSVPYQRSNLGEHASAHIYHIQRMN